MQKPTLSRHGLVAIPGSNFTARLPDGQELDGVTGDPAFFRLWLSYALDMRHGREFQGGVLVPSEVVEIARLLEPATMDGARSFFEYCGDQLNRSAE